MNRRTFLETSSKSIAALAAPPLAAASWKRIKGANGSIRIGVIGFRSKGAQHIDVFSSIPGVQIVALCDVDQEILDGQVAQFAQRGEKVKAYRDLRKLLDQKDIDAVVIAAPNHWHSLAAIWACQAGKDVYVEKPISHNIWEGRQLVEAAKKYKRIVQSGTQNRSDIGIRAFKEYLKSGVLGKVKWAHGLWFKRRGSIGKVNGPQKIPSSVDYNLWTGPANLLPLMREQLHYDWHWLWNTGDGDMANVGVHQIDDVRFLCDLVGSPRRVLSIGERWGYEDDGETPNTQLALIEYDIPVMIETRNLPMARTVNAMDHVRGVREGNIIMCENGYFAGGRGGGWVYDLDGKRVKQFPGDGGGTHQANFIEAVRNRESSILHSPIEEGHYSSVVCHMANISYRLGRHTTFQEILDTVSDWSIAVERVENIIKHLTANEVDFGKKAPVLGPELSFDPKAEKFYGDMSSEANMFLRSNYREPFVVPIISN